MSLKIKVDFNKGIAEAAFNEGCPRATWAALDVLARHSKEQVPLDTGMLKASCEVDVSADGKQGTVSYDTPYACRWHEEQANFQRGRKNKYLEDPLNDAGVQTEMFETFKAVMSGLF